MTNVATGNQNIENTEAGREDLPRRHGQPWKEEDFAGIMQGCRDGCGLDQIAERIGRSTHSLRPQMRRILPVRERHLPPDLVPARLRQLDLDGDYDWLAALSDMPKSSWELEMEARAATDARGFGALLDDDLLDLAVASVLSQTRLHGDLQMQLARHIHERDLCGRFVKRVANVTERAAEGFLCSGTPQESVGFGLRNSMYVDERYFDEQFPEAWYSETP